MKERKQKSFTLFFTRLTIFIVLLVALDFGVGRLLEHYYFRQQSGLEYRTLYSMERANEDLIILGSSRASHGYNPLNFEKALGVTAYNAGREGNFLLYSEAILTSMVSRHKPKIVILDFVNKDFQKFAGGLDYISSLEPFYSSHPEIRPILYQKSKYERLKLVSRIYPFNSLLPTIVIGNLEFNKKRRSDIQGYVPLYRSMTDSCKTVDDGIPYTIDSVKLKAYSAIVSLCKENKIPLYIICSPYYDTRINVDPSVEIARKIAEENNIPFWDYTHDEKFTGKKYFFDDFQHINDSAVNIFSTMIAERIRASESSPETAQEFKPKSAKATE